MTINGGNCSICGEEWNKNEKWGNNGPNYRGFIVRKYPQAVNITVEVFVKKFFFQKVNRG